MPEGQSLAEMPAEIVRAMSLEDLVDLRVKELPLPVPEADPYQRRAGTPIVPRYDTRIDNNGRIEYGPNYDSRKLITAGVEIIYAKRKDGKHPSHICITTFKESGGIKDRSTFSMRSDGGVWKHYATPPIGGINNALKNGASFDRELSEEEQSVFKLAIASPEANQAVLLEILALTDEEIAVLTLKQEENKKMREDLDRDLRVIDEAHRQAWIDARDTFIG